MRIIHVIPFLWSGAGNVVSRLAVSQQQRDTVAVVTSGVSKGKSDWAAYRTRLSDANVRHFEIDLFDRDPAVFWRSVPKLRDVFSSFAPDVVHCHSGVPAAAAAAVRDETSLSFHQIGQIHSWGANRPVWMNTMDLWALGQCDRIVCNAKDYRQILLESGIPADRIRSIPWGLPLDEIDEEISPSVGHRGESRPRIGFVGRIEPRKGQLDLVKAFDRLYRTGIEADLELIGPIADTAYAGQIRDVIRDRGLDGRIEMRGQVPSVYQSVTNWDLFVSLSSDEGQGIAILEAMALGVPVVSSDVPGVRDFLVDGENGLMVDFPTSERVAGTIAWALTNREKTAALASRAKEMVRERYRWETTVAEMDHLYSFQS